jgi:hypothetical protein
MQEIDGPASDGQLARRRRRPRLTSHRGSGRDTSSMTHFIATVLASLAAAAVFTLSIPADAATAEWELPFYAGR